MKESIFIGVTVFLWVLFVPVIDIAIDPVLLEQKSIKEDEPDLSALITHLVSNYKVDPELASKLAYLAYEDEHGSMVLAVMAVESTFRPDAIGPGGRGLGQINPIHLKPHTVEQDRKANRPNIVDQCEIQTEQHLFDPEMNFCAASTLYSRFLDKREDKRQALMDYLGNHGKAGKAYVEKVLKAKKPIKEALSW